jgi:hypothetical protein
VRQAKLFEHIDNNSSGGNANMNTGLKNKLLIMATAAGLAGFGVACSSDAPAAEEGGAEATEGGEASCSGATEEAAPEEGGGDEAAPEEGGEEASGGEGSCGEGSCS